MMNMTQKRRRREERKRRGLIILGIFLTACIFSAWLFLNGQGPSGEITATMPAEKVTIKAYLNLGACGKEVTDLLDGLVREYPGRVSVEYIDFGTKEGAKRMAEDGLNCQGLVINGKQTYAIIDKNGTQKDVTFSHPINEQYTADDLKTVVRMLLGESSTTTTSILIQDICFL
jgi:hypothetical protein